VTARAPAHRGAVYDVAYSPAGDRLYSYGEDGLVKAFDVASGRELWAQARTAQPPRRSRIDVRGGVVAIGGGEVELFDAQSGAPLERFTDPALDGRVVVAPAVVALGPDGAQVAAAFGSTAWSSIAVGAPARRPTPATSAP
jgi:outer membrane protein assembly factor BamB